MNSSPRRRPRKTPVDPAAEHRRPTQGEIATLVGLSQTSVSLVLNNADHPSVPAATRHRILDAAARLGYVPNRSARILRGAATRTLGCIIPDITNPFYPALMRGLQTVADRAGYDVMIFSTDGEYDRERRAIRWMLQGLVDGVLAMFFHVTDDELHAAVQGRLPVVRIDSPPAGGTPRPAIDRVYIDSAAGARAMTHALIQKGHRQVMMLTASLGPSAERVRGFREAMAEVGAEPVVLAATAFTETAGAAAMGGFLAQKPTCTAVFCANDLLAIGAMSAIRAAGLRVPEDIAVAGFDDIPASRLITPSLSTVNRSVQEHGQRAAEILIARHESGDLSRLGEAFKLPFQLVLRDSA